MQTARQLRLPGPNVSRNRTVTSRTGIYLHIYPICSLCIGSTESTMCSTTVSVCLTIEFISDFDLLAHRWANADLIYIRPSIAGRLELSALCDAINRNPIGLLRRIIEPPNELPVQNARGKQTKRV